MGSRGKLVPPLAAHLEILRQYEHVVLLWGQCPGTVLLRDSEAAA